ncbi:TPA: hypothetical protein DCW38_05050 [candidate division WOR-3 bacterium]|uniref:Pyrrolo-quinoline quinone repeat domain-containing protein n=1 Tax=candidate division WOR-3 bacterium TaxID=2052148 RepID=A0A350HAG6_UNCW3|nr:hypothetical protein [candidate division WOR-3 bacterium]
MLSIGPNNLSGNFKWSFTLPENEQFISSPTISGGNIFIGGGEKNLYSFNAKTGKVNWKYKKGAAVNSSPAVYVPSIQSTD